MNASQSPVSVRILTGILALLFVLSLGLFSYANYQVGAEPWQIATSALILSIPLVLLFFSIGMLAEAVRQRRSQGQLSARLAKLIYRVPRFAGVMIIFFLELFSFDAFDSGGSFWEMLGGFVMHSVPAIIMAVILALAWRRPWIGVGMFTLAALFFMRTLLFNPLQNLGTLLLFSGPMALIAVMFWIDWKWKKELPAV